MTFDRLNVEPIAETPPHRVSHAIMRQTWRELTFLHWAVEPSAIRRLVPTHLRLDLYDEMAWIGLVSFAIENLTVANAPAVTGLSTFPETNVRTYVIDQRGLRGVWFFSLDAASLVAVVGARAAYALPYFWATMSVARDGEVVHYASARKLGMKGTSDIKVRIGDRIGTPNELEVFLTARFRLYAVRGKRLLKADVEHEPWSLRKATVINLNETLLDAAGLPTPRKEVIAHFGGAVDVTVGLPRRALQD